MPKHSIEFEALGTHWVVESSSGITPLLENSIYDILKEIDVTWSRFRDDSMVARIARQSGVYSLRPEDLMLMRWYEQLYIATGGHVSPLVGQTLADAGYDSVYSLRPKEVLARTPDWDEIIKLTSEGMSIKTPCLIDVGAAGKGYAIDRVAALFNDRPYIIDAGGDIRSQGVSQTIGLEDPRDSSRLIGTFTVANQSICASAGNRRVWGEWHHIINPKTSRPVKDVIATWVVADNAMYADGLATALFFTPPQSLQRLDNFSFIVMYADGHVRHTDTSNLILFT